MSLKEALLIALRAVRAHWLRSALTMLGLIIGVSAVILLSACGLGVKNSVDARIEPVANNITIVAQAVAVPNSPPARPLTDADAAALQRAPDIASLAPAVTGSPTPGATTTGTLIATNTVQDLTANIIGTTDNWATTNNRNLTVGSFFDDAQAREAARVAILGPTVARTLFGQSSAALNQTVQIDHVPFRVIGVMASYGQQLDNTAVMPLNTARRYVFGYGMGSTTHQLNQITAQATNRPTSRPPWPRSPASLTPTTTSPHPKSGITRFKPWGPGCKASTRS
jgi:putative ABC transport system permease protein